MRGLRPDEFAELTRLLLPVGTRPVTADSREMAIRNDLVEQGRATYSDYPIWHERAGCYEITPAGREALRLWPAVRAAMEAQ